MKRVLALMGTTAALSWSAGARAEQAGVTYLGGTCLPEGVEPSALLRILRAELSPITVEPIEALPASGSADAVVLGIDECSAAPPSVRVSIWHGAERRERPVMLGDVPEEERTRALALALAETHIDPDVSRPAPPAPLPWVLHAPPAAPPPAPPAPRPERLDEPAWKLRASVAFRFATSSSTPAGGVGAGIAWPRFGFGAVVFGARGNVSQGDVTEWVTAGTAHYDLVQFARHFALRSSLELGTAIATGAPVKRVNGDTAVAFHAAVNAGLFGTWPIGDPNALEGGLSVGYASSLRAQADGVDAVSMDGLLLTAEVGLRFR